MAPLYLSESKKKALDLKAAVIYEDEASFRQDSTLYCTWSRKGRQPLVPVTGQRKSVKIFGCVDIHAARFHYHRDEIFNAASYLLFLDQIARKYYRRNVFFIQDNASYHHHTDVMAWFHENRKWWKNYYLPPYSPELNATERLWHHVRITGTHNRYFVTEEELVGTLKLVFRSMQRRPDQIQGYLRPFI